MSQKKKKHQLSKRQRQRPPKPEVFPRRDLPEDTTLIPTPAGEVRMSEVIAEFIEPYPWTDLEDLKKLVSLAVMAWNLTLFPVEQREKMLQELALKVPPDFRRELRAHVEDLMRRKLEHFAGNTKVILDYQVTMTPDGPHVQVISTLSEPPNTRPAKP